MILGMPIEVKFSYFPFFPIVILFWVDVFISNPIKTEKVILANYQLHF